MHRVYIGKQDEASLAEVLEQGLDWTAADESLKPHTRVAVKPNLTWPEPLPGVTTTPPVIEAVVAAVRRRGCDVTIVESNGGYHAYKAEEAFRGHGVYEIAERHGARVLNLSHSPVETLSATVAGQTVQVELPQFLLHDVDLFASIPVPKVHAMTQVSLGFKNQWGCIPNTMRLRNHNQFARRVLAINRALSPGLVVYDGTYFLDGNGPMHGEVVPKGLLIVSGDVGAGDLACCRIMGIDPRGVPHLRLARLEGLCSASDLELESNLPLEEFHDRDFRLERHLINWVAYAAFHSSLLTTLLYDSVLADPLHRILYSLRRLPVFSRIMYGELGHPGITGSRGRD